ncbi:MAG: hypothetical protein Q8O14_03405 [bacterium]|nr:hypothetical protein [bacterium]
MIGRRRRGSFPPFARAAAMVMILAGAPNAPAQRPITPGSPPDSLYLTQAIELALRANPGLLAARTAVTLAESQLDEHGRPLAQPARRDHPQRASM